MPGDNIPQIRWGTFYDQNGQPHVAPAINGYLMKGHVLKTTCWCSPRIEKGKHVEIVIHEIVH